MVVSDRGSYSENPSEAGESNPSPTSEPGLQGPEALVAAITKAVLAARSSEMFIVGAAGPRELRRSLLAH